MDARTTAIVLLVLVMMACNAAATAENSFSAEMDSFDGGTVVGVALSAAAQEDDGDDTASETETHNTQTAVGWHPIDMYQRVARDPDPDHQDDFVVVHLPNRTSVDLTGDASQLLIQCDTHFAKRLYLQLEVHVPRGQTGDIRLVAEKGVVSRGNDLFSLLVEVHTTTGQPLHQLEVKCNVRQEHKQGRVWNTTSAYINGGMSAPHLNWFVLSFTAVSILVASLLNELHRIIPE